MGDPRYMFAALSHITHTASPPSLPLPALLLEFVRTNLKGQRLLMNTQPPTHGILVAAAAAQGLATVAAAVRAARPRNPLQ
jgi:hypothetical protein